MAAHTVIFWLLSLLNLTVVVIVLRQVGCAFDLLDTVDVPVATTTQHTE